MVAEARNPDEGDRKGRQHLDNDLLTDLANIAMNKEGHSKELRTVARGVLAVIHSQAELAQLLQKLTQYITEERETE